MAVEAPKAGATPAEEPSGKGTKIIELGARDMYAGPDITIAGPPDMTIEQAQLLARASLGDVADEMSFEPVEPVGPNQPRRSYLLNIVRSCS